MPMLSKDEAFEVSDAFLLALYGDDIFMKWQELKEVTKFQQHREFVGWLIDVGYQYVQDPSIKEGEDDREATASTGSMAGQEYDTTYSAHHSDEVETALQTGDAAAATSYPPHFYPHKRSHDGHFYPSSGALAAPGHEITLSSDDDTMADMSAEGQVGAGGKKGRGNSKSYSGALVKHGGEKDKPFACVHCPYSTESKQHLDRHVQGVHERLKPFSCPHCSHKSSQKIHLKQHLISRHGYESSYTCGNCGKSFNAPYSLERHQGKCHGVQTAGSMKENISFPTATNNKFSSTSSSEISMFNQTV